MRRNQRQGKNEFVFHQLGAGDPTVVHHHRLIVRWPARIHLLSLHEEEPTFDLERNGDFVETTLACQCERGPDLTVRGGKPRQIVKSEPGVCASPLRVQLGGEPCQVLEFALEFELAPFGDQRRDIELFRRVPRHGRGIIVTRPPAVKEFSSANDCFNCSKHMPASLILASGSRYRKDLLTRLGIPFEVRSPDIDETPGVHETARELAVRLARSKAAAIARERPDAWVLGADQVAVCGGQLIGKPGTAERAIEQLTAASGQTLSFFTAACLARERDGQSDEHLDETRVHFRKLSAAEINRYVTLDQPFDCAGSFRSEGLGVTLLERIDSTDPTALVGLPLIWLSGALRRADLL